MKYNCEKCGIEFEGWIRNGRRIHCECCKRKVLHVKDTTEVKSLFDFSKRTIRKIMSRMDIGCSICGWNEAACDIHHIQSKKQGGTDDHTNLSYVCPNCHRMIHSGKLHPTMTLQEQIGESWRDYYGPSNC